MAAPSSPSPSSAPHYHVAKAGKVWTVTRVDQGAHIGRLDTRREALLVARMLAGWRGTVTTGKAAR